MNTRQQVNNTIVLIDDSKIIRESVRMTLEKAGYQVITADSALGAGGIVLKEKPALLMLDVSMPALSGDKLVRLIRANSRLSQVRVVLFSDKPAKELGLLAEQCGADGYIAKTDDDMRLVRHVDRWVRGSGAQKVTSGM